MRILMVTQFYAPVVGGEERAVEDLSTALARRGHSVAVATLTHPGSAAVEVKDGVRIHRIRGIAQRAGRLFSEAERQHAPPAPDPEAAIALRRIVRAERPDVIHAHNWLVHSLAPLKRRLGVPLVLSLHDHSLVCSTKRLMRGAAPCSGPGIRKCLACASEHYGAVKGIPIATSLLSCASTVRSAVDMFIPVSRAVAVTGRLAQGSVPYEVIPNFVRDDAVRRREAAELHIEPLPRPGFLLFVGDLTRDKGAEALIAAYTALPDAPPLILIGRPYEQAGRELPPGVQVLGMRSHATVLEAWRRCSVAVVPSILPEAFGITALEAMAAGRPVVAARSGGLADIVVDEETGLLVPPGDVERLAEALGRLLGDPDLRERMGAAGRHRAAGVFSEDAVVPRWESAYGMVAATPEGGPGGTGGRGGPRRPAKLASRALS